MPTATPRPSSNRDTRIERVWSGARQRWVALAIAAAALALTVIGGVTIDATLSGRPTAVDEFLYRAISGFRARWLEGPSLLLNQVGGAPRADAPPADPVGR